jgi:hydrogenase maturation protease
MWLVLAYGNPLRRDDGVGWKIAGALEGRGDVHVVCVQQLTPELAADVARADGVLFLDASAEDGAGLVRLREVTSGGGATTVVHALRPSNLLGIARRLFDAAPPALTLTVGGADFGYGDRLSPEVAAAIDEARALARTALDRLAEQRAPQAR